MLDPSDFPFASEFYVVEKTIEVVVSINGEPERIRIDALKAGDSYSTTTYIEESVVVQPASGGSHKVVRQWVDYDLPWTVRESADAALVQALAFLQEVCDEG